MRVLWVNYRYFMSGGPERYMFAASDLLERQGHEIVPFSVRYTRNRETPWSGYFVDPISGDDEVYFRDQPRSLRTAIRSTRRAFFASDVEAKLRRLVVDCHPDVAMVQNYLRKLSPSVLVALKKAHVPIVVRLSDFAMVCPEAHLLRGGCVCDRCITHGLSSSVRFRCVQGSLGASAMVCASMWFAHWRGYFDLIDYFIVPSATLRERMIQGGYDASRVVVLPTFVDAARFDTGGKRQRRIAYVGRLTREKGVEVLLHAFDRLVHRTGLEDVDLAIAGGWGGAFADGLIARGHRVSDRIKFLGELDNEGVRDLLSSSLVSVVPSLWVENLPNAMLESFAAGTPVVASDLGSMTEALAGQDAGVLFRAGDPGDLADRLSALLTSPETITRMGAKARSLAETRYSPDVHLAGLIQVFRAAQSGSSSVRSAATS